MSSTHSEIPATVVRMDEVEWQFSAPGVSKKVLRSDEQTGESTLLLRFEPGASYPNHNHPGGEEIYVLEGGLRLGKIELKVGDYLYTPPEGTHSVYSKAGCIVLLRLSKPIVILKD